MTTSAIVDPLFGAVVGQPRAVDLLRAAAQAPVHAYLFHGPQGSGKRAAARAFAAALLCPNGGCGECRSCRLALDGEHPDVREIEREGAAITTAQADEMVHLASLAPVESRRKVIVADEFHLLRPDAAAKLLKTVEEPSASTVFVLCADDIPAELVTIASRCMQVEFNAVADELIEATLIAEGVEASIAHAAARGANGDIDRARLLASDPALAARREAFASLAHRLDGTGAAVAKAVDELLEMIEAASEPLKVRHEHEAAALAERIERYGERGAGKRDQQERHKRELRRLRIDELRAGLAALADAYRQRLFVAEPSRRAPLLKAVDLIHRTLEEFDRNPNEALLLQALFVRLPII
ncbi:MAG: ATP-binding protein [Acidimicrobiia bacterium]